MSEVVNYVRAAEEAFEWIKKYPLTMGMLETLQKILVRGTSGDTADAGRIRSMQVFIGGLGGRLTDARFVPPPPGDQLKAGLEAWIDWVNADNSVPLVVKMALGHYQFETLHPFNDGNGRLGRLICVLQLARAGEMRLPVLNLSPWLEKRRRDYQDHLLNCSVTGKFDSWIQFFCAAIQDQATGAVRKIEALHDWRDAAMKLLAGARIRGGVARQITEDLIGYPLITATSVAKRYGVSYQAANKAVPKLVELGILQERTGKRYDRVFMADDVYRIFDA